MLSLYDSLAFLPRIGEERKKDNKDAKEHEQLGLGRNDRLINNFYTVSFLQIPVIWICGIRYGDGRRLQRTNYFVAAVVVV